MVSEERPFSVLLPCHGAAVICILDTVIGSAGRCHTDGDGTTNADKTPLIGDQLTEATNVHPVVTNSFGDFCVRKLLVNVIFKRFLQRTEFIIDTFICLNRIG